MRKCIKQCPEFWKAWKSIRQIGLFMPLELSGEENRPKEIVGSVFGAVTDSLPWEPFLQAEAFLEFVAFPLSIQRHLRDRHDHCKIAGEFMDFCVGPYIEENEAVSERTLLTKNYWS
jgi:hypothetical protein